MGKRKLIVEYDENARKDYLLGFRKRKQQRRKIAQDHIKEQAKEQKREEKREVSNQIHIINNCNNADNE